MENILELVVDTSGVGHAIYGEALDLGTIGHCEVSRASHVEPCVDGWCADLSPVNGPCLGPFRKRSEALEAEVAWLRDNWLDKQ